MLSDGVILLDKLSCFRPRFVVGVTAIWLVFISDLAFAEGAALNLGESELIPELRLDYFGETNTFRSSDDESETTGVKVKPSLRWKADIRATLLEAGYEGEISRAGIDATDFDNHDLFFRGNTDFSKRSRINGELRFAQETERFGTGVAIGADDLNSLNSRNIVDFGLQHTYGVRGARGNLTTGIRLLDSSFRNNQSLTEGSNYFEVAPFGRFSLRLAGSTRLFTELEYRSLDYRKADVLDRKEINIYLGGEWEKSSVFSGFAKLGALNFTFANDSARDGTDFGLEVGINYSSSSFSEFTLTVQRSLYDINDNIDPNSQEATIEDVLDVTWNYEWSTRVSHHATWETSIIERGCGSSNQIETDIGLELLVSVRRWMKIGVGVEQESRDFESCPSLADGGDNLDFTNRKVSIFTVLTL